MAKDIEKTEVSPFGGFDILQVRSDFNKTPEPEVEILDISDEPKLDEPKGISIKSKTEPTKVVKTTEQIEAEEVEAAIQKQKEDLKKEEEFKVKEDDDESSLKTFAKYLGDKGIVTFDPEKFEDTDEGLANLVDSEATIRATKQLEEYKQSLPDEASKFLEFVEDGGNPKEFLDIYYGDKSFENFKIDTEESQKLAIRQGLKADGWEDSAIEEEIKDYEDLGKLEAKAKIHLSRLQRSEVEIKETISKQQKEEKEKYQTAQKEYIDNLRNDWFKKEDINGFKLTSKIKEEVWNHMTKPIDRKTGLTQLAINNEKNKDAQFLYAYLDYSKWDISKLEKNVENKVASKLADKLRNISDSRTKLKSGQTQIDKTRDDSPFSAFADLKP